MCSISSAVHLLQICVFVKKPNTSPTKNSYTQRRLRYKKCFLMIVAHLAVKITQPMTVILLVHHELKHNHSYESHIQWNLDLSFFKGIEKTNDECGKTINTGNY
jgi:hypothetical protein